MTDFIGKHKLIARLTVLWAIALITIVVIRYLFKMGEVTMADATIIATGVVGLFGSTTALLKWYIEKEQ